MFKFDTEADEWSSLAPMPVAVSDHSASVLDGLVYIVGAGRDNIHTHRFDPVLGAWSTLAPTLNSHWLGFSFVAGGCLYVAGGGRGCRSSAERYDEATDTWAAVADMLEGRVYCSAVTIGSSGPAEEQDLFDSLIAKSLKGRPAAV